MTNPSSNNWSWSERRSSVELNDEHSSIPSFRPYMAMSWIVIISRHYYCKLVAEERTRRLLSQQILTKNPVDCLAKLGVLELAVHTYIRNCNNTDIHTYIHTPYVMQQGHTTFFASSSITVISSVILCLNFYYGGSSSRFAGNVKLI
jgi:hypothetical protein